MYINCFQVCYPVLQTKYLNRLHLQTAQSPDHNIYSAGNRSLSRLDLYMYPATAKGDCTVVILTFIPVSNFVCRSDETVNNGDFLLSASVHLNGMPDLDSLN